MAALCFICGGPIEPSRVAWDAPTCSDCMAAGCPVDPSSGERCDACDCMPPVVQAEEEPADAPVD